MAERDQIELTAEQRLEVRVEAAEEALAALQREVESLREDLRALAAAVRETGGEPD